MIFRYKMQYDFDHIQPFDYLVHQAPVGLEKSIGLLRYEYQCLFECIGMTENIEIFKAPKVARWRMPSALQVEIKRGEMSDIYWHGGYSWLVLSMKAKQVFEKVDPGVHQYYPMSIISQDGEILNKVPFFSMNVRRHIRVYVEEPMEFPTTLRMNYGGLTRVEQVFIPAIARNKALFSELEKLPIWQFHDQWGKDQYFFNDTLLNALRNERVTGINLYSEHSGKPGETVCPIFEPD